MNTSHDLRQARVPGHRERHPRGRIDRGVEGRQGREKAACQNDNRTAHHELVCRRHQRDLLLLPQVLGDAHARGRRYRADRDERDQQIDRDDDEEGEKDGSRHVSLGILDFLTGLRDDLVSLEGDERESHRREDPGPPFRHERSEGSLPTRAVHHCPEARDDEGTNDRDLADRDDVAGFTRLRRTPVVDQGEESTGGDRQPDLHAEQRGMELGSADEREHLLEIGAEAERVERAGHRVREPVHPAGQKAAGIR